MVKIHLNQNCRKFHEMDKSMKKKNCFHCLASGGWGVGGGGVKNTPEPKLLENS